MMIMMMISIYKLRPLDPVLARLCWKCLWLTLEKKHLFHWVLIACFKLSSFKALFLNWQFFRMMGSQKPADCFSFGQLRHSGIHGCDDGRSRDRRRLQSDSYDCISILWGWYFDICSKLDRKLEILTTLNVMMKNSWAVGDGRLFRYTSSFSVHKEKC